MVLCSDVSEFGGEWRSENASLDLSAPSGVGELGVRAWCQSLVLARNGRNKVEAGPPLNPFRVTFISLLKAMGLVGNMDSYPDVHSMLTTRLFHSHLVPIDSLR